MTLILKEILDYTTYDYKTYSNYSTHIVFMINIKLSKCCQLPSGNKEVCGVCSYHWYTLRTSWCTYEST